MIKYLSECVARVFHDVVICFGETLLTHWCQEILKSRHSQTNLSKVDAAQKLTPVTLSRSVSNNSPILKILSKSYDHFDKLKTQIYDTN